MSLMLVLLMTLRVIQCFNIDVKAASSWQYSSGDREDFFGYQVSLHEVAANK